MNRIWLLIAAAFWFGGVSGFGLGLWLSSPQVVLAENPEITKEAQHIRDLERLEKERQIEAARPHPQVIVNPPEARRDCSRLIGSHATATWRCDDR
jgi:hypothetical protein